MMRIVYIILFYAVCTCTLAQRSPAVALKVNFGVNETINPGDPLLFEIMVFDSEGEYTDYHNLQVLENIHQLEQKFTSGDLTEEQYNAEKEILESSIKQIDAIDIPSQFMDPANAVSIYRNGQILPSGDIVVCVSITDREQIEMVPDERYSLLLGILPETTIKWKQGSNEFYVRIDTMQTNSVSVAIQSGSVPGRSSEETLFDLGNFYSDCGDAQKAMDVADRLLSSNPESIDATILKADILLDLDKEPEAKQLYQMALEMFYRQFPASYEVPEYLLDMLRELEEIDRN